jgi:hypothetical protein
VGFHQKSAGVRVIIVAKRCEKRHGVFTLIRSVHGNRKFFYFFDIKNRDTDKKTLFNSYIIAVKLARFQILCTKTGTLSDPRQ